MAIKTHALLAAAAIGTIFSMTAQGQTVTCENAQFSPELMEQFPNIREACKEVVVENGEQRALLEGEIVRVYRSRNAVKVRFTTPDGGHTPTRYVELPQDFRVQIGGRGYRVRELSAGQNLTAHVKVSEPSIALASASEPQFVPVQRDAPMQEEDERTAALSMPDTASELPLLLALSGVFGLGAGALAIRRKRRG